MVDKYQLTPMKRQRSWSSDDQSGRARPQLDHLCELCEGLELSRLAQKSQNNQAVDDFKIPIPQSHKELRSSPCEVFQLLACLKTCSLDPLECSLIARNLTDRFTGRTTPPPHPDTTLLSIVTKSQPNPEKTRLGHVIAVEPLDQRLPLSEHQDFNQDNINFALIREWIGYCSDNHKEDCPPAVPSPIEALDVIDCTDQECINKGTPKVVKLPSGCKYAALSYVWGDVKDHFPQVVKDSVKVVSKLNCKYLWVDRLCIPQEVKSSEEAEEKHRLIARMDKIYSEARFTIVDAAGEDGNHGLAGVTRPRNPNPLPRYAHVLGAKLTYLGTPAAEKIRSSRWASRGWTFQEGILSRRRIFFTDEQVMFQCNNMTCLESFKIPMSVLHRWDKPNKKRSTKLTDTEPLQLGSKCIGTHLMEFSKRNLTNDIDTLEAILGVLNDFRKDEKCFHVKGNPIHVRKEDGHQINAWYHVKPGVRNDEFPSWSWTGWKGEIKMTSHGNADYDIQLFDKAGHSTSLDEYREACGTDSSQEMDSVIQLEGMMTNLSFELIHWDAEASISKETVMEDGAWAMLPLTADLTCYSLLYLDEAWKGIRHFDLPVMLLESGVQSRDHNVVILVLGEEDGYYKRVGMVILWGKEDRAKAKPIKYRDRRGNWIEPVSIPKLQDCMWYKGLKHKSILLR